MHILFLIPYPEGEAPSQRFRFEQYLPVLEEKGHRYSIQAFLSAESWKIIYKKGNGIRKARGLVAGFLRRIEILFKLRQYDAVFIHREASPIGPPVFEWLIAKAWKKPIIYDFDDAIWLANTSEQNKIAARLKFHQKTAAICRWSKVVSCGNSFLAEYAHSHTRGKVVVNPTTIDTHKLHSQLKEQDTQIVIIGWTGTHSTLKYLKILEPVLEKIAQKFPEVEFRVISNQPPDLFLSQLKFIPWNKDTEIEDLLMFNIGLMPLEEDQWSAGKCGFKALQYMALGIPPVVSPVGVNTRIVQHEVNGYIAGTEKDWLEYLEQLILDSSLRREMGGNARQAVMDRFSVDSNTANFLRLFSLAEAHSTTKTAP